MKLVGPADDDEAFFDQMIDVGLYRQRGGGDEAFVEPLVDQSDDLGDRLVAVADGAEDCLFAPIAVDHVAAHHALRLWDAAAVAGEENGVGAADELFERGHVGGHAAFRRRDDGGVPAHDVVAGKHAPSARAMQSTDDRARGRV